MGPDQFFSLTRGYAARNPRLPSVVPLGLQEQDFGNMAWPKARIS